MMRIQIQTLERYTDACRTSIIITETHNTHGYDLRARLRYPRPYGELRRLQFLHQAVHRHDKRA